MSNQTHQGNPANRPTLELVIRVDARGEMNVTGPIHDKILCFGLLECAKEVVREFGKRSERAGPSPIEIATVADLAANGIQITDQRG